MLGRKDKRRGERVIKDLPTCIYLHKEDGGYIEINAVVKNISENGISFDIENTDINKDSVDVGVEFSFIIVDGYGYYNEEKDIVLQGVSKVKWYSVGENIIHLGCAIIKFDSNWSRYVTEQTVKNFIAKLPHNKLKKTQNV